MTAIPKKKRKTARNRVTGLPCGRPTGPLLVSASVNPYEIIDVFEDKTMFGVFYMGKLIKVRRQNVLRDGSFKYKRTTFASRKQAQNVADKLNTLFLTDQFEVFQLDRIEYVRLQDSLEHVP